MKKIGANWLFSFPETEDNLPSEKPETETPAEKEENDQSRSRIGIRYASFANSIFISK